jgi:hypothetical protein
MKNADIPEKNRHNRHYSRQKTFFCRLKNQKKMIFYSDGGNSGYFNARNKSD